MPLPRYAPSPLNPLSHLDTSTLKDKSVIVTGGASGLGLAYVTAFAGAGAFVTFGDINEKAGASIVSELGERVQFVKCDVTVWEDQVRLFKAAVAASPGRSCDVVVANAGISGPDGVFASDDTEEPVKPDLKIMEVNGIAPLYTVKLAQHYFDRQPESAGRDRCLIIKSSLAGYLDLPGSYQYNASKWAMRGLFRCIRRTGWMRGVRVNLIAPWFIETPIMSAQVVAHIKDSGVVMASADDAAAAVLRVASDKSINGRALGIVPRKDAEMGYVDLMHDDYDEGDVMESWQQEVLATSHRTSIAVEHQ